MMTQNPDELKRQLSRKRKIWLGLSASLIAISVGCDNSAEEDQALTDKQQIEQSLAEASASQTPPTYGGEGGEGGEMGVDPATARSDPKVFLEALAVIRAHYLAGAAAFHAGGHDAAAEMFVHPIGEIYFDLEKVLEELGAPAFLDEMQAASDLALQRSEGDVVDAAVALVLAKLDQVTEKAPASDIADHIVKAEVLARMIDRAALQYQFAVANEGAGEAWLDGYGFYLTAYALAEDLIPKLRDKDVPAAQMAAEAVLLLSIAFPSVLAPEEFAVEPSQVIAVSSRYALSISGL